MSDETKVEDVEMNDAKSDETNTGPVDKIRIPFTLKGKKGIRYLLNRIKCLQQENDMRTELREVILANHSREIKSLMKVIGKLQDELYDAKRKRMYEIAAHENIREELEKLKKSADIESRLAKSYFGQSNEEWDGNSVSGSVFNRSPKKRVREKYPNAVPSYVTDDIYEIVDTVGGQAISNTFTTPELAWNSAAELMDQGRLPTPRVVEPVKEEAVLETVPEPIPEAIPSPETENQAFRSSPEEFVLSKYPNARCKDMGWNEFWMSQQYGIYECVNGDWGVAIGDSASTIAGAWNNATQVIQQEDEKLHSDYPLPI